MVIRFLWHSRDLSTPGASATEVALAFPCVAAVVTQEGSGEDLPTLIYVLTGHTCGRTSCSCMQYALKHAVPLDLPWQR